MSHGPGAIERRIGDLFAASHDRALDIDEIIARVFDLPRAPSRRTPKLSAIRPAHRLIRRLSETDERRRALYKKGQAAKAAKLELERIGERFRHYRKPGDRKHIYAERETWRATLIGKGRGARLMFHLPDVPVEAFAVKIDRNGVHWFPAEVVRVTDRNVMVRYGDGIARLDRETLWHWWAFWRGVMFVSSRSGRIAAKLDQLWWDRYGQAEGGPPPAMRMPLAEAMALLGVPADYARADVIAAFRRKARIHHPDMPGGSAEMFRKLIEARDRLLAAIGETPPEAPVYYPSGTVIHYRSARSSGARRLGASSRRLLR
jgi:hypothetical protein